MSMASMFKENWSKIRITDRPRHVIDGRKGN